MTLGFRIWVRLYNLGLVYGYKLRVYMGAGLWDLRGFGFGV